MSHSIETLPLNAIAQQHVFRPQDFGTTGEGWSITQRRLRGGLSEGVETLEVNNGALRFTLLPTRGMGIWKAWRGDLELGWQSPVRGPVHPAFVNLGEPSGLGWLDGFDELLVRCGWESNGAPEFDEQTGRLRYPLHGRIANKPAQEVSLAFDAATQTISVRGVVEETRFHFTKLRMTSTISTQLESGAIHVCDEIENFSESSAEVQMLYHINFGVPLLDGGSRLHLPFKTLVPRNEHSARNMERWNSYAAPQAGTPEEVYFFDVHGDAAGSTRALLKNAQGTQGVSVLYNTQQLPCFSLWKNTTGARDGYVTGLEPGTNYPNPRSYEGKQQRVVKLAAGGRAKFEIGLETHVTASEVTTAEQQVAAILGKQPQQVFPSPQEGWCA
jgi:Domain of unknown function (DUF4432)